MNCDSILREVENIASQKIRTGCCNKGIFRTTTHRETKIRDPDQEVSHMENRSFRKKKNRKKKRRGSHQIKYFHFNL